MPDTMLTKGRTEGAHIANVLYCVDSLNVKVLVVTDLPLTFGAKVGNHIDMRGNDLQINGMGLEFVRSNEEPLRRIDEAQKK